MKGPQFNARVTKLNQQSDQQLARIIATYRKHLTNEKRVMMEKVLRPYLHAINAFQEENANIDNVYEAFSAVAGQMALETLARTHPKSTTPEVLADILRGIVAEFNDALVEATNMYYGTNFTTVAEARPQSPLQVPPTGTVN